jgi:uncharacterized paraquat-inducible protein A
MINRNLKGAIGMKYCEKCKEEFDTEEQKCPICKADLVETEDNDAVAETVALMITMGIL